MENERIKTKVFEMLTDITDEVDPKNLLERMVDRRIINIEDREKITSKETKKERCRALIYHLLECSKKEAFIVFMNALKKHYPWIVDRIADGENKGDSVERERLLAKELDETKMKLQEANRKTDELQKELASTNAELKEARRKIEELELKIKLESTDPGKRENERIKNKVFGMRARFVDEVEPKDVLDLLIQEGIVNKDRREKIMNKETQRDRCRALLDFFEDCSNDKAFTTLKEALRDHYPWIVERINALDADNDNEYGFSTSLR